MKQISNSHGIGSVLLEVAVSMAMIGIVMATLLPIIKPLRVLEQTHHAERTYEQIASALEAYSIAAMKLPCPSLNDDGQESINTSSGSCLSDHGYVPWSALGIRRGGSRWIMHTASLNTLGPPFANTLTTAGAIRQVQSEALTRAVFNTYTGAAPTSSTAPAFQICDSSFGMPSPTAMLCNGNPISGSAVVVVIPNDVPVNATHAWNQSSGRLFIANAANNNQVPVLWMNYERLMWLWLQAGVLP